MAFKACMILYYISFSIYNDNECWSTGSKEVPIKNVQESTATITVHGFDSEDPQTPSVRYYSAGNSVNLTCEHNYYGNISTTENYHLSWKQLTENGDMIITYPSNRFGKYTISTILYKFDSGTKWCCTVFNEAQLQNVIFRTFIVVKEKPEQLNSYKHYKEQKVNTSCIGQDKNFTIENGKIKVNELKSDNDNLKICMHYNLCTDRIVGQCYKRSVTYMNKPKLKKILDTITNRPLDNKPQEWRRPIIVIAGAGFVIILIIVIIIIIIFKRRCKNTSAPEELYATTHELVYAQLEMLNPTSDCPRNNENAVPYAQVVGVMVSKNKRK